MRGGYTRLAVSIAACLIVLAAVLLDFSLTSGSIFMNEELSVKHVNLRGDCAQCHLPWEGVKNKACENCHENLTHVKKGALCEACHSLPGGGHVKTATRCVNCHSVNGWKTQKASAIPTQPNEQDLHAAKGKCQNCHQEHKGERFGIAIMVDKMCNRCHDLGKHAKVTETGVDQSEVTGLFFGHRDHYRQRSFKKMKCVKCHADKGNNEMHTSIIDFARGCGDCHTPDDHSVKSEDTGTCPFCHLREDFKVKWKNRKKTKNFQYSHETHAKYECKECHNILKSDRAFTDITAVELPKCYKCHEEKSVSAGCGTCHDYHNESKIAARE